MNTKINLFTVLIILYSIVVCSVFKKSDDIITHSAKSIQAEQFAIAQSNSYNVTKEVITATLHVAKKDLPQ